LRWGDVRNRTIVVERALALGELKETKTRRVRSVRLLAPLAEDLAEWREASSSPIGSVLVFPRADGENLRPYDLRHAFVSALLAEGRSVLDVAAQAGHAPSVTYDTYGHVIHDLEGVDRRSAESVFADARVHWVCTEDPVDAAGPPATVDGTASSAGLSSEALLRTRTADPLLTMEVLYQLS
jgi:hypothetical protein